MIPAESYLWNELAVDSLISPTSSPPNGVPFNATVPSKSQDSSLLEVTVTSRIFENHSYCVHHTLGESNVAMISKHIYDNGGTLEQNPKNAEYVVFGSCALMNELIAYDTVVTDLYIDSCLGHRQFLQLLHPLFVPLPQPPFPIFDRHRFVLRSDNQMIQNYVKNIIEENGGIVVNNMDSKSYKIMLSAGSIQDEKKHRDRIVDFSWVIASMSQCRLQPTEDHLYKENSKPLENFQREDDVWIKSTTRERDSTEDIEVEVEERHRVPDRPVDTSYYRAGNVSSPYENPYFPDLRKPYKMNLNLDGIDEYINNMDSPSRETQESLTTSRVGSILRKAVANTGRQESVDKENGPSTCDILQSRVATAENRRTVSSTPVLVRDVDRPMKYMPMDESFADQNQEHEELNRQYAMHPHFLLSVSSMNREKSQELREAIKQLGGRIENDFNRDVTHLISSNMLRSPKVLSSIAAGKWCLTPEYVISSAEAGRWLNEKPFEWCPTMLKQISDHDLPKDGESRKILEKLVSVCSLWRIRVSEMPITCSVRMESRYNGAFSDWCCVIHHDDRKTQQISSILEAGGATVYSVADYIEITTLTPNKVLASKEFKWNPQSARMLKDDHILIYVFDVIYEYLVDKDNFDFSKFLHPVYQKV
uniref:BRCT domain-containing protein n=1 Tax=Caenorhabditis tropicalis TaxID=1561998 RepID=A0A1I7T8P4_9PELO